MFTQAIVLETAKVRITRMVAKQAYDAAAEVEDEPTVIRRRRDWRTVIAEKQEK